MNKAASGVELKLLLLLLQLLLLPKYYSYYLRIRSRGSVLPTYLASSHTCPRPSNSLTNILRFNVESSTTKIHRLETAFIRSNWVEFDGIEGYIRGRCTTGIISPNTPFSLSLSPSPPTPPSNSSCEDNFGAPGPPPADPVFFFCDRVVVVGDGGAPLCRGG